MAEETPEIYKISEVLWAMADPTHLKRRTRKIRNNGSRFESGSLHMSIKDDNFTMKTIPLVWFPSSGLPGCSLLMFWDIPRSSVQVQHDSVIREAKVTACKADGASPPWVRVPPLSLN